MSKSTLGHCIEFTQEYHWGRYVFNTIHNPRLFEFCVPFRDTCLYVTYMVISTLVLVPCWQCGTFSCWDKLVFLSWYFQVNQRLWWVLFYQVLHFLVFTLLCDFVFIHNFCIFVFINCKTLYELMWIVCEYDLTSCMYLRYLSFQLVFMLWAIISITVVWIYCLCGEGSSCWTLSVSPRTSWIFWFIVKLEYIGQTDYWKDRQKLKLYRSYDLKKMFFF